MLDNGKIVKAQEDFLNDAKKRYDETLAALLTLAYQYKRLGADFSFDADDLLFRQAIAYCADLSDSCLELARKYAQELIVDSLEYGDEEVAFETASSEYNSLALFDASGERLLDLLGIWCSLAFAQNYTKSYTLVMISRFADNPHLSPLWREAGQPAPRWGTGHSYNVYKQYGLIGGDLIINSARYAEWIDESAQGATYYILHRGSTYDCDICDEMCEKPIPMTKPFLRPHPRCMCYPEYFYVPLV